MIFQFFRLLDDIQFEGRWQLSEPRSANGGVNPCHFTTGRIYKGPTDLKIAKEDGVLLDFTLAAFDVPVVTEHIASLLRDLCPHDIQFIPIKIEGEDGKYAILNVLRTIECLKEPESVFSKWSEADGRSDKLGQYRMVAKLVIDQQRAVGADIFRIAGWDVPIIVSRRIKVMLEQQSCIGAIFKSVCCV